MSSRCDKKHSKPANNAARERSRVQSLRAAFLDLQRSLPSVPPDTKLSKLDVLVLATGYIYHLTQTLEGYNDDQDKAQVTKHTTFNTAASVDHESSPTTIQTPDSSSIYTTEKSSNFVYVGGKAAPEMERKFPKERLYSSLISNLSHKVEPESPSYSGADHRLSSNLRVMQWNIPRQKKEMRPRMLTNQNGSIGILHPVKKWPMRCRLYDKILGHEPIPLTLQAWRKEQRGSL